MRGMSHVSMYYSNGRTTRASKLGSEVVNNGIGRGALSIHLTACILGSHQFHSALVNEMHWFHLDILRLDLAYTLTDVR